MLNSYLKIAIRQLRRQNIYSIVNLVGLTLSMSCVLLLFLYLREELSYDRAHPDNKSLYRVVSYAKINGNEINTPATPSAVGPAMDVNRFCRIITLNGTTLGTENQFFTDNNVYAVDESFFDLFYFNTLNGDIEKFSSEHIILTPSLAEKLFGSVDPIGKTLRFNDRKKIVSAVIEPPERSHLNFSALTVEPNAGKNWARFSVYTYIHSQKTEEAILRDLKTIYEQNMEEIFIANNSSCEFDLQKVSSIHLKSHLRGELEVNTSQVNIYAFILIAIFMLLVSGINYSNMATARSLRRSKEIGIRKAIGSYRSELIAQFLVESILLVFFGIFLSLIIVDQILPYFNVLTGVTSFDISNFDWQLLLFVVIIVLTIGILGGLYPAVVMSGINASDVMKGIHVDPSDKLTMRRLLVVVQFSISVLMIICTWFIARQIEFINTKNLGYQTENLITMEMPATSGKKLLALKERFSQLDGLESITISQEIPGETYEQLGTFLYLHESGQWRETLSKYFSADEMFTDSFDIPVLEGENFKSRGGSVGHILVNETFARNMGNSNPVGTTVRLPVKNAYGINQVQIIGIVGDFHFRSLHAEIQPLAILYEEINPHMVVRIEEINSGILEEMQAEWKEVYPEYPFDYEFLDDKLINLYKAEQFTVQIFGLFALITSLLAFLGLFALSFYTSELRKKEIGIRKINGAGIKEILYLINKEYLLLVTVATVISWPVAYYIVDKWLAEFAYKIDLSLTVFIVTLILALFVTLATVSVHSLKAANTNIIGVINRG